MMTCREYLRLAGMWTALATTPTLADAQASARTVEVAVEHLQSTGGITAWELYLFDGCPQEDPVGRRIFEAVTQLDLDGEALLALATAWQGAHAECGYAPMGAWYVDAFNSMVEQRAGGAMIGFLRVLPPLISDGMQEALLRVAEDGTWDVDLTRIPAAAAAIRHRPQEQHVEEAIAAFRRGTPRHWVHYESQRLGRTFGATFFSAIAREAHALDDDLLITIGGAIAGDIRDGFVQPSAGGLGQLRSYFRTRSGVPDWAQIPETRGPAGSSFVAGAILPFLRGR